MALATVFNLAAPDLIILALIALLLGVPIAVVVTIVRSNRSRSAPPPLPKSGPPSPPKAPE